MIAVLAALAITAALAPGIITWLGRRGFYVLALAPFGGLVWVFANWPDEADGIRTESITWVPELQMNIDLRFDTLAAIMSVLVLGVGALVLCYCAEYFSETRRRVAGFGGEMVAFAGAMFGLVCSDNMLVLYIFWELTTVLSFLLVGFYAVRATSRRAATQALLVTTAGGLAMLVGIIMLGETAGSYSLSEIVANPPVGWSVTVAIVLILVGALSKSAIFPFHFWLPGAMAAPTPVSAYLHAAAMVKAGIFLVARLAPAFSDLVSWHVLVVGLGMVTMLLGGFRSLREYDLKLVLAFGTVSQLGFLMVLVGIGDADVAMAALAMLVAHAFFKAALFMVVGIIDHSTGTRDLRKLARLGKETPLLAVIAALAAASMAGIPLTLGFVGKETAFAEIWDTGALSAWQGPVVVIVLVLGSILTVAYSLRFIWGAFGRKRKAEPSPAVAKMHKPNLAFQLPALFLAVAGVAFGPLSGLLGARFEPYADTVTSYGSDELVHLALWHGFNLPLLLSAIAIVFGTALFALVRELGRLGFVKPALGNADRIYDAVLRGADTISINLTRNTQRGSLPLTQGIIIVTLVLLPTIVLFTGARNRLELNGFESPVQLVIGGIMIASAIAAAVLRNRLAAVLVVGVTGYSCGVLFALHGAPDLALTQFLVETLTLVIFVLVLRKLPAEAESRHATGFKPLRALLGLAFGALLVLVGLFAAAARTTVPMASELPNAAYKYGDGSNAVNVLLVDIRAWDTLGEVSVLLVAATGVASMVFRHRRFGAAPRVADATRARTPRPESDGKEQFGERTTWLRGSNFRDPRHRSMVLEATTRIIFPTMIVLSLYFFYAGHNAPGGGFAGGLTMGLALVLRYLAGGRYELGEALPIDAGRILGVGLGFSVGTAVASVLLGAPALSSATFEFTLPIFGDVKLVTAIFFDLGVYLIVVGLVLDVLRSLGARLDEDPPRRRREPQEAAS
ncbi:MAG: Na+/H+ antiporter subunit A [Gordonia sp.]|uniref:Na+/H+ antiporter subunit A n=1 Tax=Gordonia rubripertincta TaxID=36822 RepID=A0ABT4N7I4_GORRU|nr:Na+/H+ antiporter subunit A [Gordonia rubripertincta]MBA4023362.1 Na+/H+ antiporter subunit A [Gordonia sp. (in: high G+C Gram-positive bacteria)]MCZ4553882.1 Na+/H+ antiporter subunit A [Gordonia rubripertincta]